jgi:hypothetical protein
MPAFLFCVVGNFPAPTAKNPNVARNRPRLAPLPYDLRGQQTFRPHVRFRKWRNACAPQRLVSVAPAIAHKNGPALFPGPAALREHRAAVPDIQSDHNIAQCKDKAISPPIIPANTVIVQPKWRNSEIPAKIEYCIAYSRGRKRRTVEFRTERLSQSAIKHVQRRKAPPLRRKSQPLILGPIVACNWGPAEYGELRSSFI